MARFRTVVQVRILGPLALILIVGAFGLPAAASTVAQPAQCSVQVSYLDNGLRVVMAPRPGTGLVAVNVWVGVGSAQDPPDRLGLAHFFEHMVFKGSKLYPGNVDYLVESKGGYINASTSKDYTEYYVVLPAEHASFAIELLADILLDGSFPKDEIGKERDVVLRERDENEDDPDSFLLEKVYEEFYGDHPYAFPVLGTAETLEAITREDFLEWRTLYYSPNNLTVVMAGDFAESRVLDQIRNSFGSFASRKLPSNALSELVALEGGRYRGHDRPVAMERMVMAWPGPSMEDLEEVAALDVFLEVYNGYSYHD